MHRVGAGFCIWTFSTSRPSKSEDDALCQQTNHLDARRDSIVSLLWLASEVTCWSVASVAPRSVGAEAAVLL